MENLSDEQLRLIFRAFNHFMLLLWKLGLAKWGNGTEFGGYIMVLNHTGRKSGLKRQTPINYAEIDGDIYCTAAFGSRADWYLNIMANPLVELWLPDSRWAGEAEDASKMPDGPYLLRQVIIASGFAGPLFGVNPKQMSDEQFAELLESYKLVRIRRTAPVTGPGGPGELAWIWPLTTLVLLIKLMMKGKRRRRS